MEKAFLQDRLTKNPFQDPMGNDAHQGLERWLDKFHQPTVPNYTIITDPEFFVFLWFHNAVGNLITCPYLEDGYVSKLDQPKEKDQSPAILYSRINTQIGKSGIQSGTDNTSLPFECVDLTPFVRQATLPEIKPANGEPIDTLFGKTSAGSFSPYASDGQQSITLQMVDTEFSILDSLFYPWMKDINSPWWYRPDKVYTEWATPYPMATLEVQRPRMRYRTDASSKESRKDSDYTYYSYKYIGVKPTNYAAFEVNGGGVSNLLRALTLSCDMCLVDLTGDVAGSGSGSTNLGNRTGFIFAQSPNSTSGTQPDQEEQKEKGQPDPNNELNNLRDEMDAEEEAERELADEIEQQEEGDMPGEDEDEWIDKDEDDYNEDEYEDSFGDGEEQDCGMDCDEEDFSDDMEDDPDFDNSDWEDEPESWEDEGEDEGGDEEDSDPNGDLDDYTMEQEAEFDEDYGESEFTDEIQDEMMDVGSEEADAAASEEGWIADDAEGSGLEPSMMEEALGGAVDLVQSGMDLVSDVASEALSAASGAMDVALGAVGSVADAALGVADTAAKTAMGVAGSIASSAMNALEPTSAIGQAIQSAQTLSQDVAKQADGLLSTLGNALGNTLGKAQTAFGAVANAISAQNNNSTTVGGIFDKALSSAFSSAGSVVGNAANVLGGAISKLSDVASTGIGQVQGAMQQMVAAKEAVGVTSLMSTALNSAASAIASSTQVVGDVAKSVLNVGVNSAKNITEEFGQMVRRMTTSNSAKPTPLEGFVGMVTKQNAKGSSMA